MTILFLPIGELISCQLDCTVSATWQRSFAKNCPMTLEKVSVEKDSYDSGLPKRILIRRRRWKAAISLTRLVLSSLLGAVALADEITGKLKSASSFHSIHFLIVGNGRFVYYFQ